jgi:2-polyprenyl-3-methyl-5-hydroxy-6-metoxy-1,4-benzoquinol methylase
MVRLPGSCLKECRSCGTWSHLPRPAAQHQAAIHNTGEYFDHPYFALRRKLSPALRRRCRDVFDRLGLEPAKLAGTRLLDIGCDTGAFLLAAREQFGIEPVGIDVSDRAIAQARQQDVEAYVSVIQKAPVHLAGFEIATAIDLVEHVADAPALMQAIRKRLRRGGLLYMETPNIRSSVFGFGSCLSRVIGGRPSKLIGRLFPPHHVHIFTAEGFRHLAESAGFEVVRLHTRVLPARDIAASSFALALIEALQLCDRILGREPMIWAVLRRPWEDE